MIELTSNMVLLAFLVFCRVGGCLMFMPGFSSARIPAQARLFVAIAVSLALTPIVTPTITRDIGTLDSSNSLFLMISEVAIGAAIGLMGRMFFLALSFIAVAMASFIGLANLPGIPLESAEPNPTLSALLTLSATVLFFIADLHWEVLRGLVDSYAVMPVSGGYDSQFALVELTNAVSRAFMIALQISSPLIVFSISINFLFGIMNKFTPQIAVYFVSLPFVIFGGMALLYLTVGEILTIFIKTFGSWLVTG